MPGRVGSAVPGVRPEIARQSVRFSNGSNRADLAPAGQARNNALSLPSAYAGSAKTRTEAANSLNARPEAAAGGGGVVQTMQERAAHLQGQVDAARQVVAGAQAQLGNQVDMTA